MSVEKELNKFISSYFKKKNIDEKEFMLIGIRDEDGMKKDIINDYLSYRLDGELKYLYRGTTDPGVYWTTSAERNKKGTFHLKTGFHKKIWCLGKHRGYTAFVNNWKYCLPTEGWRDADYNFDYSKKDISVKGHYGINCHRMHKFNIVNRVGKYSGGCQVFQSAKVLKAVISVFKDTCMYNDNKQVAVDYMLFDIKQLPKELQQKLKV